MSSHNPMVEAICPWCGIRGSLTITSQLGAVPRPEFSADNLVVTYLGFGEPELACGMCDKRTVGQWTEGGTEITFVKLGATKPDEDRPSW